MLDAGLREVDNPSEILLSHYETPLSGIAVGASVDGIRSARRPVTTTNV